MEAAKIIKKLKELDEQMKNTHNQTRYRELLDQYQSLLNQIPERKESNKH